MKRPQLAIQWFPGHMTKAKRMIEAQLKLVDVAVELLDARAPRSSRSPLLGQLLAGKPRVLALNKADMADSAATAGHLAAMKEEGCQVCLLAAAKDKGLKELLTAIREAARPALEKWQKRGLGKRAVRVMILGIPNVGKSTLINRLAGKNKAAAEDRPGVTRGQQWVHIAQGMELLDTPGVLSPKLEDESVGFALAVTGAIREEVFDREQAALLLTGFLADAYPQLLRQNYSIDIETDDSVDDVVAKIAVSRGCIKTGGSVDVQRVLSLILRDFRSGRLGRATLDPV